MQFITNRQIQRAGLVGTAQRPGARLGSSVGRGDGRTAVGRRGRRHELEAAEVRAVEVDGIALTTLERTGGAAIVDGRRVGSQQVGGAVDTGVAATNVAHGALERGIPDADEDVTEAAFDADRAVAGAEAVAVGAAEVSRRLAVEPGAHAAAQLLFTFEADVRTRRLQDVDACRFHRVGGVRAGAGEGVFHVDGAVHLHGALCHRHCGRGQRAGYGDCH